MIELPDISSYQDDNDTLRSVDFVKMATQTKAVIIKAGQGNWMDSDFKRFWVDSKAAGLARGSYWYFDARYEPKIQARKYVDSLAGDLGELPMVLDLEAAYSTGNWQGWKNWVTMLDELKRLVPGKEIVIYTGYYYFKDNGPSYTFNKASLDWFKQFPLWIASYNPTPTLPYPWTTYLFWQYTDNGNGIQYGVESLNIDLNKFNGSWEDFAKRFGLAITPEPPTPTPTTPVAVEMALTFSDNSVKKYKLTEM